MVVWTDASLCSIEFDSQRVDCPQTGVLLRALLSKIEMGNIDITYMFWRNGDGDKRKRDFRRRIFWIRSNFYLFDCYTAYWGNLWFPCFPKCTTDTRSRLEGTTPVRTAPTAFGEPQSYGPGLAFRNISFTITALESGEWRASPTHFGSLCCWFSTR